MVYYTNKELSDKIMDFYSQITQNEYTFHEITWKTMQKLQSYQKFREMDDFWCALKFIPREKSMHF